MKVRRLIVGAITLVAISGVLAACGSSGDTTTGVATQADSGPTKAQQKAQQQALAIQQAKLDKARAEAQTAKAEAKQAKAKAKKQAAAASSQANPQPSEPAPTPEPKSPPNVVGLTLPTAKKALSEAGFTADVSNTDTAFGIVVPSNYTVCTQDAPRGSVVPILAQKYGC